MSCGDDYGTDVSTRPDTRRLGGSDLFNKINVCISCPKIKQIPMHASPVEHIMLRDFHAVSVISSFEPRNFLGGS